MGRGPVQVREASSHTAVGRQVDATWSGRICTWPVLTTDTLRIGSVMFIACSPVLVAEPGGYGCSTGHIPSLIQVPLGAGGLGLGLGDCGWAGAVVLADAVPGVQTAQRRGCPPAGVAE